MMRAENLRCEYLTAPLGVDFEKPRLSWTCAGGKKQTAYRIVTEKWDSGRVETDVMHAEYPLQLTSRERVTWKVCLWDENGEAGAWSESFFEAGLLSASDWEAAWITGDYAPDRRERYPVDCFRKTFPVGADVVKARLYITALGLYEAKINGRKAGDFVMAPGYTDYSRRVQYQTYDVADLLQGGENALTVQLADGWYRGSTGAWGLRNQFGTQTKLLAQLEVTYADGVREVFGTDAGWAWSDDGPIRFADNKDGEVVEAFRTPTYRGWARLSSHKVVPTASGNVPVTEHERFRPVSVTKTPNGRTLFDFGQNLAGYVSFAVNARVGQRLRWRFGEMLGADGNLTLSNIQTVSKKKASPLQEVIYTCGEGENRYTTTFAVFGFRYAEVETDMEVLAENVEAVAVYSDMAETGRFESSNELLNRFVDCTKWSAKSNSLDIPTDCPTRERHGWTGDAQIFFGTASYLFDYAAFSRKYLRDVYDWQKPDGRLPQIAPYGGVDYYMWTMNGSVGWSDIGILLPYRFAKKYGDKRILSDYYARMKKYAGFMMRRISPDGVVRTGQSYGEWAEPADVFPNDWKDMILPHPEVSTAYTAYVLRVMADIAKDLGHAEDEKTYRKASRRCTAAYRKNFGKDLDTDRQALLVRPLAFGLLDKEQTAYARQRLMQALDHYHWRLGTGFLSTPLILSVLETIDIEAAYHLLENEKMPGWLFMPKSGATTIWESWEGTEAQGGIASLNHYSKGAVCEWLFDTMCGIRVDGENHFTIAPKPGGHFTYARAEYDSVYGTVKSGWERDGGTVVYTVTIPANCTATVVVNGKKHTLGAGTYRLTPA